MAAPGPTLLMLLLAFAPPLAYAVWVRNLERHDREPWLRLAGVFAWGATGAVLLAIALARGLAEMALPWYEGLGLSLPFAAVTVFALAPLAEEPTKALALLFVQDERAEPEDGFVYGAVAGLGFAAAETFLYAQSAYALGGTAHMLVVGGLRGFASAFLHATASGLVGYAFMRHRAPWRRLAYVALAIGVHALYNLLLSAQGVVAGRFESAVLVGALGLVGALALAITAFTLLRKRVRQLDAAP